MTRLYAEYDWRTGHCVLTGTGHATGSEQVCAAISALVTALDGYLENAKRSGEAVVWEKKVAEGDVAFNFTAGEEGSGAFLAIVIGLKQVALQEPKFAEMEIVERHFFDG